MIELDVTELVEPRRSIVILVEDAVLLAAREQCPTVDAVVGPDDRVVARGPRLASLGVPLGARSAQVRARIPDAVVLERDPVLEERRCAALHLALWDAAPGVGRIPGACAFAVAVRSATRYYGGEPALLAQVRARVESTPGARVGLGDSVFAALVASLDGRPHPPGRSRACVGSLDVSVLPPWLARALETVGLRTLGAFQAMEPAAVAARFGAPGLRWHQLVRVERDLVVDPAPPAVPDAAVVEVEDGWDATSVRFAVSGQLAALLAARSGAAPTRWRSWVECEQGAPLERLTDRPQGAAHAELLASALVLIERALARGGRLVRVGVEVRAWTVPQPPQLSLTGVAEARAGAVRAVLQALQHRFGSEAVLVAALGARGRGLADRVPWVPWSGTWPPVRGVVVNTGPWPGSVPGLAPTYVVEPPRPVSLRDGAGREVGVSPDGVLLGEAAVLEELEGPERVLDVAGPWVVRERWWERRRASYARLLVHTERRWCWVRRQQGGWWLEGGYG